MHLPFVDCYKLLIVDTELFVSLRQIFINSFKPSDDRIIMAPRHFVLSDRLYTPCLFRPHASSLLNRGVKNVKRL